MDSIGTRRPVIPMLVQDVNGDQVTTLTNTVGTPQDTSNDSTVVGLLKKIDSLLPITPSGGDDSKNVEYVYLGCSSDTDISTATNKYKLSTPSAGGTSFRRLYDLSNYTFGSIKNEFIFTEAGIFFIGVPLTTAAQIKVRTFKGYRTGGLPANLSGYGIFCDKDNNILQAVRFTDIAGNNIFWAFNTNIPIS